MENEALKAELKHKTAVESAYDYIENFDILETITNVGNDEVFTPRKTCNMMLDILPDEVWHNPNYKWLNPASKNGIFEREIAIRLDKGLEKIISDVETRRKHILQNMIYSIGLTKFTANVARRTLYYCSQANRNCDGILAADGHFVNGYAIGNGTWFDDEEGNVKTPNTDHYFEGKSEHCKFCGVKNDSKYLDANQIEKYAYEFIHIPAERLNEYIANRFFKGDTNMKFDVIVGNPPYHMGTGGGSAQAAPIYQKFVDQAIRLNPKYLCMIIPSRWFAGGLGLDSFRDKMLNDRHITKLVDYANAKNCFPVSSIGGGVCYFLRDKDYDGDCLLTNEYNNKTNTMIRKLNEFDILIRYNEAIRIINKINHENSLSSIVSSLCPFGITSNTRGSSNKNENLLKLYSSDGESYINKNEVTTGVEYIDKYKIMISKTTSEHASESDKSGRFKVLSVVKKLKPQEVCTFSYFLCGCFEDEKHADNLLTYLKTKFVRFLLLQSVSSINLSKDKFLLVPNQDFSFEWTDEQLYKKYNLDKDEIEFIESLIKPME